MNSPVAPSKEHTHPENDTQTPLLPSSPLAIDPVSQSGNADERPVCTLMSLPDSAIVSIMKTCRYGTLLPFAGIEPVPTVRVVCEPEQYWMYDDDAGDGRLWRLGCRELASTCKRFRNIFRQKFIKRLEVRETNCLRSLNQRGIQNAAGNAVEGILKVLESYAAGVTEVVNISPYLIFQVVKRIPSIFSMVESRAILGSEDHAAQGQLCPAGTLNNLHVLFPKLETLHFFVWRGLVERANIDPVTLLKRLKRLPRLQNLSIAVSSNQWFAGSPALLSLQGLTSLTVSGYNALNGFDRPDLKHDCLTMNLKSLHLVDAVLPPTAVNVFEGMPGLEELELCRVRSKSDSGLECISKTLPTGLKSLKFWPTCSGDSHLELGALKGLKSLTLQAVGQRLELHAAVLKSVRSPNLDTINLDFGWFEPNHQADIEDYEVLKDPLAAFGSLKTVFVSACFESCATVLDVLSMCRGAEVRLLLYGKQLDQPVYDGASGCPCIRRLVPLMRDPNAAKVSKLRLKGGFGCLSPGLMVQLETALRLACRRIRHMDFRRIFRDPCAEHDSLVGNDSSSLSDSESESDSLSSRGSVEFRDEEDSDSIASSTGMFSDRSTE